MKIFTDMESLLFKDPVEMTNKIPTRGQIDEAIEEYLVEYGNQVSDLAYGLSTRHQTKKVQHALIKLSVLLDKLEFGKEENLWH
jgi:hypothetical protein